MKVLRYIIALVSLLGILGSLGRIGNNENQAGVMGVILFWAVVLLVVMYYERKSNGKKVPDFSKLNQGKKSSTKLLLVILGLVAVFALIIAGLQEEPTYGAIEQTLAVEQPQTQVVVETPVEDLINATDVLNEVNKDRANAGIKPLVMDDRLNASAQKKVDEIVSTGYYSHNNLKGEVTAYDIEVFMPECLWFSENLNNNAIYTKATVESWLQSESHKNAILDGRYEYTGIAINNGFIAQHFCSID